MTEKIDFSSYIDERPDEGIYRVDRSIFTDPALFELEMKYIFLTGNSIRQKLPKK